MQFIIAFIVNWFKGSWQAILKWIGIAGALLAIYFKGKSSGKNKEIEKQKDLTIDLQHRQIDAINHAPKTDQELDDRLKGNGL